MIVSHPMDEIPFHRVKPPIPSNFKGDTNIVPDMESKVALKEDMKNKFMTHSAKRTQSRTLPPPEIEVVPGQDFVM